MRLWVLVAGVVVAGVLVGFFVTRFLNPVPPTITATTTSEPAGEAGRQLHAHHGRGRRDQGQGNGEHPNWVGYLPTTYLHVPAGAVVHMTINQQDGSSGLRNPYFSLVRGTINNQMTVNGKVMQRIDPDNPGPGHTFTIPDLGVNVPLEGVAADAPASATNVVQFDFVVPDHQGLFRWQCFVPCGAGTLYGNGGPMQTLGYMAGELQVG